MTTLRQRMLSMVLATLLLAAMLLLSSLHTTPVLPASKTVMIKNVQVYVPPPPPPPEPVQRRSRNPAGGGSVKIDIQQKPVELGHMKLDTSFSNPNGVPVLAGQSGLGKTGFGAGDFGNGSFDAIVSLDQLDGTPMVLGAPFMPVQNKLLRKGIRQYQVVFQIMIDENGKGWPVRVVQSPDPELDAVFMDYAAHVTFTPPLRKGAAVKAQYLWPVVFTQ